MRKTNFLALSIVGVVLAYGGCTTGSKVTAPQEWDFAAEKVWEISRIGGDELLRPAEPRIGDDGTLYFHDFERHLSYIVDAQGELIGTFAKRGDGEGEVPFYLNCFPAKDHVVVCGMESLHFFTGQGAFVKSIPNNPFARFPLAFKDGKEFWVAPGALGDVAEGPVAVTHVDLASGEETAVHEFERTDEEKKPTGGGVVVGLTPQIKAGYDRQTGRVYFGKNTDSTIYWLAEDGGEVQSFTFGGQRGPVTEADKRSHFARFNVPEEALQRMIGVLPDKMAFYDRIQAEDGLVYLFSSKGIGHDLTQMDINMYSPDGRHRYSGRIEVEDGWHIAGGTNNLQLAHGSVFVVQEDNDGHKKIVKYRVKLPANR